jgi:hypothetical protein
MMAAGANIIDVKWILSEETGRLRFEGLRCVSCNPRQQVIVEHVKDTVSDEFLSRYRHIVADRKARGIRDD